MSNDVELPTFPMSMIKFDKEGKPALTKRAVLKLLADQLNLDISSIFEQHKKLIVDYNVTPSEFAELFTVVLVSIMDSKGMLPHTTPQEHKEQINKLSHHFGVGLVLAFESYYAQRIKK